MFSQFFINRPIFAGVISIVIVIIGAVSLIGLPIAQYPDITPPTVLVTTSYPGANAQVVADTVAAPIEQQINGVEKMLYMSSTCGSDGSYALTITFEVGSNLDMSTVLVQNRLQAALANLPDEVKRMGVVTKKSTPSMVLAIALVSDGRYDDLYLTNYATLNIVDELKRISGVGDVVTYPSKDYSMRVWLDPDKLRARNITTTDVTNAIRAQNVQVAAGQIGRPPAPAGQNFQLTVTTLGRLSNQKEFEDIIIKTADQNRITRVRDVARVELGGRSYDNFAQLSGQPTSLICVYQSPSANALNVAEGVQSLMKRLSAQFPVGMKYTIPYDTTLFVKASIHEVIKTLIEAFILVFITIYIFLQDWRTTLIPAITIPVSLIGTFAVMSALGFSINMLTMFGLVLAIGIVVDDAIVVVENVARNMEQHHLGPKEAAIKAMQEVSGPVIAISLVLMSVFIPAAMLGGMTGQLYRQFALTIAAATGFSALNALTLSPALCAVLLRPHRETRNPFFRGFNWAFNHGTNGYTFVAALFVRRAAISMLLFAGLLGWTYWEMKTLPTGFLPVEDQGYAIISVQLPDSASLERTGQVVARINDLLKNTPGVKEYFTIGGLSVLENTSSSNCAALWVVFKPWEERKSESESQDGIVAALRRDFAKIQEAYVMIFIPPAIQGLGTTGGFQFQLQAKAGTDLAALGRMAWEMVGKGNTQKGLSSLYTTFSPGVPQLYADIDRVKAQTMNVPLNDVFDTLQCYLGSTYVNDFNKFGRTFQVNVQADAPFRTKVEDIERLEVRNKEGNMVPLGAIVKVNSSLGPQTITRYNLYPAATITGEPAEGYSSGQAIQLMEQMAKADLPSGMGYEWTGITYQQIKAGNQAPMVFALAVVFVFLVLAAQYESWSNPIAVILVVPLGILGALLAVGIRLMDVNIYTQIGLILLVALSSKNAILIVEFARELHEHGKSLYDATVEAAKLRFRPILMTSIAFICGVVPLVVAEGAAAASRQTLGTAVFGGMISGTVLAVLFVPVFYVLCQGASNWLAKGKKGAEGVTAEDSKDAKGH